MKNKKITRNISQGMYVLTTDGAGCMVDAVSQVSYGDNPLISVAVNKNNYTNKVIKEKKRFAFCLKPVWAAVYRFWRQFVIICVPMWWTRCMAL